LCKDDALLGAITAFRQEVRPFSDNQIALLQNFAAQAVIAMENARLITETREALEQQTETAEVLEVINSSPGDVAPVFEAMLERAICFCQADEGVLTNRNGDELEVVAVRSSRPEMSGSVGKRFAIDRETVGGRVMLEGRTVHIRDVNADPDYCNPRLAREQIGTLLGVPLLREGVVVGSFSLARERIEAFTEKQIAVVESFAAQAVIAIENARLLGELHQRTDEVADLNRGLEARVAEQVEELGRVGRLKRFLAPQLAELIVSQGDEKILESHRREIVVVFCDLRGYTAFTETAEPEEVLHFLREYHGALGPLVSQFEGTLDQFSGDGIMVFFNDPVPIPDPAERAVKMAMAMREAAGKLIAEWRERGRDLGFGAGIAQGYATLGQIGFSERSGYTAIGTVCNVAARLCAEAKDGQILLSQLVNVALKGSVATEQVGALALKGLTQPVVAYNVPFVVLQPALRVIEGGPQSV
jgi:adenylate cyclase